MPGPQGARTENLVPRSPVTRGGLRASLFATVKQAGPMAKPGRIAAAKSPGFTPQSFVGTAGFVRVARTEAGQWWLVDAENRPFFSRGVAAVNRYGRATGRATQPTTYELAVNQRYGPEDSPRFVAAVRERLRAWHCNTLGPGTAPEFFDQGLFFLETVGFRAAAPEATIKLAGALLPDVFDPRWVDACEGLAAEVCAPLRASRGLIGYCTDHDLHWSQPPLVPGKRPERPSLLQICLSLEPSFPAYHAAWEFVLAPHGGELGPLAKAWGIEPNKEALRQLTLGDQPLSSAGYRRDLERFTREFAHRYFHTCAAAIRRCDPHHLVLGCVFEAPPGAAVLAESVSPAVDLLAVHGADVEVYDGVDAYARVTALPVLLTGFSWTAESFLTAKPDARRLTTVERMLANGRGALTRAFAHPALVGYAWSNWADWPEDGPPFGRGVVHVDDGEAREHTELLTELNQRAESLHRSATAVTPPV